jgi:tetratricopeptide (TPR) repeat protein
MSHVVVTDHSIPRVLRAPERPAGARHLESFWNISAGLAYAELAIRVNEDSYFTRAFELLTKAAAQGRLDPKLLSQLAWLYDRLGDEDRAIAYYERALELDAAQPAAAITLGALYAKRANLEAAIRLWKDALERNPGLEQARMNLAVAQMKSGNLTAARATLEKALEFSPDLTLARKLLDLSIR